MDSTGYLTYVSEMLSTHDAVVIPGFGGFITKYKSARVASDIGQIFPPTKYIAFNEQLDIHDNTFARFLDENTAAHYSPRLFDHFIANLKSDLTSNQVIVVPKVGRLYQDFDGVTHFMPNLLNLNNDTYGLPQVKLIKGDWKTTSPITQAAKDIKDGGLRMALSAAATVALLFLFVWGVSDITDNRTAELSIIETVSEDRVVTKPRKAEIPVVIEKEDLNPIEAEVRDAPMDTDTFENNVQKAVIIVGAFGSAANATKMIQEIEALGYAGYQDQPYQLTRVGVNASYTTQEELDSILANVQKRITSRAWILK